MATVPATKFKAQCLELMDRVAEGRKTYVITKRGKPVAKLVPADPPRRKSVFGCMADQMEIVADLDEPLRTDDEWRKLAAERSAQWRGWDREWRSRGTISGRRTVGQPSRASRAVRARRGRGRRSSGERRS